MALINCPECQKQVSDKANSCIHCGFPLVGSSSKDEQSEIAEVDTSLDIGEAWKGFQLNSEIICPSCHKKGCVIARTVKRKAGISGAKATGALLTGGLSLLAVGLSKKEMATEAKCKNCNSVWSL